MSRLSGDTPFPRRVSQVACVLLLGLLAAPAWAQVGEEVEPKVTGTIVFESVPRDLDNVGGTGFHWRIPAMTHDGSPGLPLSQMRVVLVHSARSRDAQERTLKIGGYRIEPLTVVIKPGASLSFVNLDEPTVRLKAVGWSELEPVELEGKGDEASLTLDKPGRYLFRDSHSTSVLSYVIVAESIADAPLISTTSKEARFDLGTVPAGAYKLKVYFRGAPVLEKDIKISRDGSADQSQFLITGETLRKVLQRP